MWKNNINPNRVAAQASLTTVRDLAAQLGVSAGTAQKLAHLKEG